jgi:predicted nuclease of restriction endonuclease-like RecB superfamily
MKKEDSVKTLDEVVEKATLKWRLSNKPTLQDVEKMLGLEIISKEEARKILFSEESTNDKVKAHEEQVQFLQRVVDKLSSQPPQVVWKYVHDYTPRQVWLTTGSISPNKLLGSSYTTLANMTSGGSGNITYGSSNGTTIN